MLFQLSSQRTALSFVAAILLAFSEFFNSTGPPSFCKSFCSREREHSSSFETSPDVPSVDVRPLLNAERSSGIDYLFLFPFLKLCSGQRKTIMQTTSSEARCSMQADEDCFSHFPFQFILGIVLVQVCVFYNQAHVCHRDNRASVWTLASFYSTLALVYHFQ